MAGVGAVPIFGTLGWRERYYNRKSCRADKACRQHRPTGLSLDPPLQPHLAASSVSQSWNVKSDPFLFVSSREMLALAMWLHARSAQDHAYPRDAVMLVLQPYR